jgi:hypothetical protein
VAIADDFSISSTGDIRYTGSGTNYTVIQLHRWLGDLMDDAQAAGNDILDITDSTASERSTDNIITLKSPYNIDDIAAQHLYDGSIIQSGGDVIYDGVLVFAAAGTYLAVQQNGKLVTPNFWTTGLNADAANGISHRFMLKVRTGGADIDGRRLIGQTREFGFTFSEFRINGTARGNNVMALTYATDLNNQTSNSTVSGYTTISNTEGYRALDVDNNAVNEYYYSEWNKATYTINQFYERTKWLSQRSVIEDSNADTGTNYALNNTTTRVGQGFSVGANGKLLSRVHVRLKKVGSATGNLVAKLYAHTGTFGSAGTATGSALATSVNIDVSKLTTSYAETEIGFDTQYFMTASTNYFISIEYTGTATDYVHVEGDSTGTHAGNLATYAGSWTAQAAEDLNFKIFTNARLYGLNGEIFRGITHEINIDGGSGTWSAVEHVSWSGGTGQMLAINNTTATSATKMWIQLLTGVAPTDNQAITGTTSSASNTVNVTITERTLSQPFIGASTGSALIGAYGVGLEVTDLSASDKVFDLTNTQVTPPNYVTFTVGGLISGEDRVLVGPESGGLLQSNQFTLNGALTGAAVTAVVINTTIPSDTPATGTIRILLDTGIYRRVAYTSYTGSTFTIASTDFSGVNQAANSNNVFISYIDKLATAASETFTVVYNSNRALFVRVRDGGTAGDLVPIKTFETAATLGSAGGSVTAIRTSDA